MAEKRMFSICTDRRSLQYQPAHECHYSNPNAMHPIDPCDALLAFPTDRQQLPCQVQSLSFMALPEWLDLALGPWKRRGVLKIIRVSLVRRSLRTTVHTHIDTCMYDSNRFCGTSKRCMYLYIYAYYVNMCASSYVATEPGAFNKSLQLLLSKIVSTPWASMHWMTNHGAQSSWWTRHLWGGATWSLDLYLSIHWL